MGGIVGRLFREFAVTLSVAIGVSAAPQSNWTLDNVLKQITGPANFVTVFYARVNPSLRTLQYANGGHNPPLLVRTRTQTTLLLEESGPIVGILPDAQFTDTVISLESGDILTFYTDGVTEQENENEEQFSIDRLKDLILSKETDSAATLVSDGRSIFRARATASGPTAAYDTVSTLRLPEKEAYARVSAPPKSARRNPPLESAPPRICPGPRYSAERVAGNPGADQQRLQL